MHLHERRAKCLWTVPEDSPPVICCNSLRRTNRSTIPRSCRAYRKDQSCSAESGQQALSTRSRHAPTGKDTASAFPSSSRTCRTRQPFPREFRRPIRICYIGKTNELLRTVPAVIPRVCAGATGVLPLGLGG